MRRTPTKILRGSALCGLALALAACQSARSAPADAPPKDAPYVVVLGTAQDAGLPQIACDGPNCVRARRDPSARRLVTSLLLVDPRDGRRFLFDATPDLREQVERMRGHPASRDLPGARPPIVDGVFLTHAHIGHYAGLIQFGPEAYGARGLTVFATERMGAYLRASGPWSLLVENGSIAIETLAPDTRVQLADDLSVTALPVPHRDEFSDTVAFRIDGPSRSLLYLPDIDKWERWDAQRGGASIESALATVDVALLDASFFDDGEIPGRNLADIPHPFVVESIARFAALPAAERAKVVFTHLNHSNPAADPRSPEAARVRAAGMRVARDGQLFGLGPR